MSLLPEHASYLEQVQAYFLAFRGDGVALSPLDAQLLADWKSRQIPYSVICRAIRKSAESLVYNGKQGARLRTLRSCRQAVEREFCRWQGIASSQSASNNTQAPVEPTLSPISKDDSSSANNGPQIFALKRLKKARATIEKELASQKASPGYRNALERALGVLNEISTENVNIKPDQIEKQASLPSTVSALISKAEDTLALVYVRNLSFEDRCFLIRQARELAGPKPACASPRARKDALRAHLVALARARAELVVLA